MSPRFEPKNSDARSVAPVVRRAQFDRTTLRPCSLVADEMGHAVVIVDDYTSQPFSMNFEGGILSTEWLSLCPNFRRPRSVETAKQSIEVRQVSESGFVGD